MSRPAFAQIDIVALNKNFERIKSFAPDARVMAVVKADAYGHDARLIAGSLSAADGLAVASIDEAVILRESGVASAICIFAGFSNRDDLDEIRRQGLNPVIHGMEQLELIHNVGGDGFGDCWIKVDSGMHRAGFLPEQVPVVYRQLLESSRFNQIGFMSHLASADDPTDASTSKQLEVFKKSCAQYSVPLSMANSAAIVSNPDTHLDWVRPGIMLYGCSPLINRNEADLGLDPVMTFGSRLMAIKQLKRGHAIGYGATWVCPEDMSVGLVACGYGDGYPRHAPNGTPVFIRNVRSQLLGRVSMDSMSIDLRVCPEAKVGDNVELWGKNISVSEVASRANTISYELLTKVTARVNRC